MLGQRLNPPAAGLYNHGGLDSIAYHSDRGRCGMKRHYSLCLFVAAMVAFASVGRAENWPQWRGPAFNGSSSEKTLPDNLDEKGALWSIELPGRGASTPIVWGERIFLTTQGKDRKLVAHCFDAK